MEKKEFINIVESLDAEFCSIRKKDKSLSEALGTWITLFEPMGRLMDIAINSLRYAVNDKYGWVDYYIYDLDFGRKYKKGRVKLNGKDFKLKTASDLWDLINLKDDSNKKDNSENKSDDTEMYCLLEFLWYLNDKNLINNHDFDYKKEAKLYLKTK